MFTRSAYSKAPLTSTEQTMSKNKTTSVLSAAVPANTSQNSKITTDTDDHVGSLDELLLRMQQMFENTNTRIEASVENCKADLQAKIDTLRTDVHKINTECSSEIRRLSDSVKEIGRDVRTNKQRIIAAERLNDLLLSGVPYHASEDLMGHVSKISSALGYTQDGFPLIYAKRLARTPIAAGATPPIALQFAFKFARDDFYNRYLSSRNLSLTHLGFDVNKRIFINENLTEEARRIKALAVKQKKDGKIAAVYTRNGIVFVKGSADAAAVPIHAEDQLAE